MIESNGELDEVAVYTAAGEHGEVAALQTAGVPVRKIRWERKTFCGVRVTRRKTTHDDRVSSSLGRPFVFLGAKTAIVSANG